MLLDLLQETGVELVYEFDFPRVRPFLAGGLEAAQDEGRLLL